MIVTRTLASVGAALAVISACYRPVVRRYVGNVDGAEKTLMGDLAAACRQVRQSWDRGWRGGGRFMVWLLAGDAPEAQDDAEAQEAQA